MNNVKNSIMWADYTINPVKGLCPVACDYCYARAMYKRFKWNPEIRFDIKSLLQPMVLSKPSRIFVGSTIELFGSWIDPVWLNSIFYMVKNTPQHTFIFLTKKPENLARWSPFPKNCWVGTSITNHIDTGGLRWMEDIQASVKFISFEPLRGHINASDNLWDISPYQWLILGGQSGTRKFYPPEFWIQDIEDAADKAGIPVFEKQNLRKVWLKEPRREWPK